MVVVNGNVVGDGEVGCGDGNGDASMWGRVQLIACEWRGEVEFTMRRQKQESCPKRPRAEL